VIESELLIAILKQNGVAAGATLVFEANCLENESPEFGASLAAGLESLVSQAGLLVVPTCTPVEGQPKPTFDAFRSPSEMGWFSEFFRRQPGVHRSSNPTHSVAAWGSKASELVSGHRFAAGRQTPWGESPFGLDSPWDRLYSRNSWWVIVNPEWYASPFASFLLSLYHERLQGITKTTPFPEYDPECFAQKLEGLGFASRFAWEPFPVHIFKLRETVEFVLAELTCNPETFGPTEAFRSWLSLRERVEEKGYLLAGVCKTKITPPAPLARWDGRRLTGVFRDLYARAVVFADGPQRVALVVCDLVGMTRDLVLEIRKKVQSRVGLPSETILIACTHAHSTPDTITAGFGDLVYLTFLVDAVADAVCQAAVSLQPVRVGWNRVPIRGLAHSRRKKLRNGQVYTTRYSVPSTWRVQPELIAGEGPIDPDLTVGRIERLNGEVLAVIANFGCHASVALTSPNVSGDYPGEAMAALESMFGEESVVLCTMGAAADVDPTLEMPYWGPRDDASAQRLGRIYAAQILEALERVVVKEQSELGITQALVDLPVREDWMQMIETDKERMLQEYAAGWQLTSSIETILKEKVIHTEVQALRLGGTFFAAFPGEVFVETGCKLKQQFSDRMLAIIELANDSIGYIPPRKAFEEGGYECGQHFGARIPPEGEAILAEAAEKAIIIILSPNGDAA
jgi:neutral ceramidase